MSIFLARSDQIYEKYPGESLKSPTKTENKVKSGFLLNIVVTQSTAIFELLSGKDKTLLIRRDSFLVLDLSLDVINGIRGLHIQGDGLSSQSLHKDLHTSTETKDQVESRFLLNVVVRKSTAILQLLSSKDQSLLIRWDTLLILNLGLNIVNRVAWLNVKSDGLSGKSLYENLRSKYQR